jgi:hypothetical protein
MHSQDRRSRSRFPVCYPVHVSTHAPERLPSEDVGEVTDLSWGGMFIRAASIPTMGTEVDLVVILPRDADPVVPLKGRVVWIEEHPTKGPGMGISVDLSQPLAA